MFVRWNEQEVEQEGQGRLPGYQEAVVRHFDAPEALDTRFYEVHAKSALNRVPKPSRMPFPWTINPYRGCCMPALLRRGRHAGPHGRRPDPRDRGTSGRGTAIYGTAEIGRVSALRASPRCSITGSVRKPAYRVTLENGTEIDHQRRPSFPHRSRVEARDRSRAGPLQRPHLTRQQQAGRAPGAFAEPPRAHASTTSADTSAALSAATGTSRHAYYDAAERPHAMSSNQFRLALTDFEALSRAHDLPRRTRASRRRAFQFAAATGTPP